MYHFPYPTLGAIVSSAGEMRPGRLWSLLDMLRFYSEKFLKAYHLVSQLESASKDKNANSIEEKAIPYLLQQFDDLGLLLDQLGLSLSHKTCSELRSYFNKYRTLASLGMAGDLARRMHDELELRYFLALSPSESALFEKHPPFGDRVETEYPKASYDVSEAAKCLALGRSTACVFHLMRVVELGMIRLADSLSLCLNPRWGWQRVLTDGLEPAINSLPEITEEERGRKRELQRARAHLHGVRLGYRNDTMHPKETYTEEEARELFGHVGTFMGHLAERL